ncbi:MAG: RNA polymerase sigma-70 factor [Anaerolineae bacterium]
MEHFETHRSLLFAIAYRMLGSAMDAEDMVQETYLRYQSVPTDSIQSPKAFLTTIITRLCVNQLNSARAQRESYIGPWLPEPLLTPEMPVLAQNAEESISMAFLVLLETLTPVERAVFLLREIFDYEYAEIAEIVSKDETTCRQLFSRARKHIAENRPRFKTSQETHRQMLDRFMGAISDGELDGLMQLLSQDVTMWADGGGKARGAATRPLIGREAVARFLLASTQFLSQPFAAEIADVNGEPAAILRIAGQPFVVLFIAVAQDNVSEIRVIGNPDKLGHV